MEKQDREKYSDTNPQKKQSDFTDTVSVVDRLKDFKDSIVSTAENLLDMIIPPAEASNEKTKTQIAGLEAFNTEAKEYFNASRDILTEMLNKETDEINLHGHEVNAIHNRMNDNELAFIKQLSDATGIPKEIIVGLLMAETGHAFSHETGSDTGAFGRFQIIAGTALDAGGRVLIKAENLSVGEFKVEYNGIKYELNKDGNLVHDGKVYPPEDDRFGIHSWFLMFNILYKKIKNCGTNFTWQNAYGLYNGGQPDEKIPYQEKALRYAKAARQINWDSLQNAPEITSITLKKDVPLSTFLKDPSDFDALIHYSDEIGPLNGHLGLFRIPLKSLNDDLRIPIKYTTKPNNIEDLQTTEIGNEVEDAISYLSPFGCFTQIEFSFARQVNTDEKWEITEDGKNIYLDRTYFKYDTRNTRNLQTGVVISKNSKNEFTISSPEFVTSSKGRSEPPTIDDLVRAGIDLQNGIFSGNNKERLLKDPAVINYFNSTYLRSGTKLYFPKGSVPSWLTQDAHDNANKEIIDTKLEKEIFDELIIDNLNATSSSHLGEMATFYLQKEGISNDMKILLQYVEENKQIPRSGSEYAALQNLNILFLRNLDEYNTIERAYVLIKLNSAELLNEKGKDELKRSISEAKAKIGDNPKSPKEKFIMSFN